MPSMNGWIPSNSRWNRATTQAEEQIREIAQYIAAELKAPKAALRLLNAMEEAITSLSQLPQRVELTKENPWHSFGIHKMPVKISSSAFWMDEKIRRSIRMIICFEPFYFVCPVFRPRHIENMDGDRRSDAGHKDNGPQRLRPCNGNSEHCPQKKQADDHCAFFQSGTLLVVFNIITEKSAFMEPARQPGAAGKTAGSGQNKRSRGQNRQKDTNRP